MKTSSLFFPSERWNSLEASAGTFLSTKYVWVQQSIYSSWWGDVLPGPWPQMHSCQLPPNKSAAAKFLSTKKIPHITVSFPMKCRSESMGTRQRKRNSPLMLTLWQQMFLKAQLNKAGMRDIRLACTSSSAGLKKIKRRCHQLQSNFLANFQAMHLCACVHECPCACLGICVCVSVYVCL